MSWLTSQPLLLAQGFISDPPPGPRSAIVADGPNGPMLLRCPDQTCATMVVANSNAPLSLDMVSLLPPASSFTPTASPTFFAWNDSSALTTFSDTPTGPSDSLVSTSATPPTSFLVGCATGLDINSDGVADVALSGALAPETTVLLGEGDGTFGRRPRFLMLSGFNATTIDADGQADLVVLQSDGTFSTYFGQNHEFALAATGDPLAGKGVNAFAVGGAAGSPPNLFVNDLTGAFWRVPARR